MIEQLRLLVPDAARAERVAARCRATLERRRPAARPPAARAVAIERVLGLGFCVIYLSAVFLTALEMAGAR